MTDDGHVNRILMADFVRQNLSSYVGYITMVLLAFPLQYLYVPRALTKFVNHMQLKTWWVKPKPFLSLDNAEGSAVFIVGAWVFIAVCFLIRESIARYIVPKHTVHVRQQIYKALLKRYEEEFQDIPTGNVITRLLTVSELYVYMAEWVMQDLIPYAIGISIFIIYSWTIHRGVGTAVTIGLGSSIGAILCFLRQLIKASNKREQHLVSVSQEMNNSFSNLMNIYINNQTAQEVENGKSLNEEYGVRWMKEMKIARNMNIFTMGTTIIAFGIVIALLLNLVKKGKVNGFEAGAMIIIYVSLIHWMQSLFLALPQSLKRLGSLENAMPFLSMIFSSSKSSRNKRTPIVHGRVRLQNVTFTYPGESEPVLKKISLTIEPNERIAIIGRSGSGKTTIMKLLVQLYTKYSGNILIDDVNINTLEIKYLRGVVNYVNQQTVMHDIPIIENIQYGNNATVKEIQQVLNKYDLKVVFDDIPNKIHANAGIGGNNLSLGMQKCVVILRGIFRKNSKIVIFDEPIAGLDPETAKKIMRLIHDFTKNQTVIMITHNEAIKQYVNYSVSLADIQK
jgi:ABC-type multidrug transport system fused ATPase/permease subunit